MSRLPDGWEAVTLGQLCLPVTKIDPVLAGRPTIRYVDIGSVDGTRHELIDTPLIDAASAPTRARQVLAEGDTVFSTVRPYLEKIAHVGPHLDAEFASTGFCVLRPGSRLDHRWLFHFATSRGLLDQVLPHQRGVSYPAVRDKDVLGASIPLPPIDEQRRIVDTLEGHLSRLDAAAAQVAAAQQRLNSMEASALSLARQGREVALAEVAAIQGGIQKQPKRAPRDNCYPFLRVANVTARGLELDDVHQIELFGNELDRLRLEAGDLLVVEGNGSPSQIGRAATWDGSIANCVHQNHLIRVRPGRALLPEYLEAVWNSPETRRELTDLSSSSSGLHTLSVSKLLTLQLPVPSRDVQASAVAAIREVRDSRQRLDLAICSTIDRGARLRRALLSAAFSGRLT